MSELDKKDPEGQKPEGNSDNAAPDKKDESGNAGQDEDKKSEVDLEEETYKERFSKSQKEVQDNLLPQLKLARKKLGLGENDPILDEEDKKDEDEDADKDDKAEDKEDEKNEDDKDDEQDDDKKEEKQDLEKKEVPLGVTPLRSSDPVTQTLYDEIWTSVSKSDREDMDTDPKVRENMVKYFPLFLKDSEGNTRSYRQALIDTYEYVNRDSLKKREFDKGRAKGLLDAKSTGDGTLKGTSSRQPDTTKKGTLSEAQQKAARGMGLTDEEYLAELNNN